MSGDNLSPEDSILEMVSRALEEADETLRQTFDRSLSADELVSDRWERAHRLGFGSRASVYGSALVYGDVTVGQDTWIGPWVLLDGSGGSLTVGSFCSISAGVQIYTHDTVGWAVSGGLINRRTGPVSIGANCYIGPQSIVAADVEIGAGSIVGANSFVSESVPESAFVAGSPARLIGRVTVDGNVVRIE